MPASTAVIVEAVLTTSEVEFVCAQNGVHARKTACKFSNPLNLYAIMAMEQVRRNRVILLEAVAGRLRKLGHPEEPIAPTVLEPKAARKPREFKAKDDKEPIVTKMLAFERPEPTVEAFAKALRRGIAEYIENDIINGPHTRERPCPKCKGVESRGARFGYRKMKHTLKSGEVRIVTRRQARCNKCRGGYVKAKTETATT